VSTNWKSQSVTHSYDEAANAVEAHGDGGHVVQFLQVARHTNRTPELGCSGDWRATLELDLLMASRPTAGIPGAADPVKPARIPWRAVRMAWLPGEEPGRLGRLPAHIRRPS
jgi:hypothetical protein